MQQQQSILQEIMHFFTRGSILSKIIGVNAGIFLLVNLFRVLFFLFNVESAGDAIMHWLGVSSNIHVVLHRPWTLVTYMFLHFDFFHILFNMIVLYVGGRLFSDFIGADRLTATYLIGGLFGAFFYIISFNIFPVLKAWLTFPWRWELLLPSSPYLLPLPFIFLIINCPCFSWAAYD